MTPLFKEKDDQQYAYVDSKWVKCGEATIASLWHKWVVSPLSKRYIDEEGFIVFGFKQEEQNVQS